MELDIDVRRKMHLDIMHRICKYAEFEQSNCNSMIRRRWIGILYKKAFPKRKYIHITMCTTAIFAEQWQLSPQTGHI